MYIVYIMHGALIPLKQWGPSQLAAQLHLSRPTHVPPLAHQQSAA